MSVIGPAPAYDVRNRVARPNTKSNTAATTNNPLVRADGRSAQGRRTRDLYRAYRFALKRALRRCRVGKVQRHFLYV
jgi:hypothetical protein